MMRSHFARHVCRTRTGVLRDATSCRSRTLCLRSGSTCVPPSVPLRLSQSRRPYSTDPFPENNIEDKPTERQNEAKKSGRSAGEGVSNIEDLSSAISDTGVIGAEDSTSGTLPQDDSGDASWAAEPAPEDKPISKIRRRHIQNIEKLRDAWHDPVELMDLQEQALKEAEFAADYFTQDAEAASSMNAFDPDETGDGVDKWLRENNPKETPRVGPWQPPHHDDELQPGRAYSVESDNGWLSDSFRKVLRNQTSGVTIVTAHAKGSGPVGATVSSLTSVSLRPRPYISFNLHWNSSTLHAILLNRIFNINFLDSSEAGIEVAEKFVGRSHKCSKEDLWHFQKWVAAEGQPPVLLGKEIPYVFRCRLVFTKQVADHSIVVAEVLDMSPKDDVPDPARDSGFLSFRDGWYREPGLDPHDNRSVATAQRDAQRLEVMRIQEARRQAHLEQVQIARESRLSRERRAEYSHQRRQEAHERKQWAMKERMMKTEMWEANIRHDEREKLKAEMATQLERNLLDEAHEMLKKKAQEAEPQSEEAVDAANEEVSNQDAPEEKAKKKFHRLKDPELHRIQRVKKAKERAKDFIPPWTN